MMQIKNPRAPRPKVSFPFSPESSRLSENPAQAAVLGGPHAPGTAQKSRFLFRQSLAWGQD